MIIRDQEFLVRLAGSGQVRIYTDSRQVTPGGIFVALPAGREHGVRDGAGFIPQAVANGAAYIVCTPEAACRLMAQPETLCAPASLNEYQIALIPSETPHALLGELAAVRHDTRNGLELFAVTGTNGKTTTAYLLEHLLSAAGSSVGMLGTINYRWPGHCEAAPLTTPGVLDIHERLQRMRAAGASQCVMEASSHALDQHRLAGLDFSGAVFTNLTQDHLDYHGTMDDYFASKARLFLTVPRFNKALALNADDVHGRELLAVLSHAVGFGLGVRPDCCPPERHLHGEVLSHTVDGLHMRMRLGGQSWELVSPLVGLFNASNLLAVQALGISLGLPAKRMEALTTFTGVPGRLERIANNRGLHVFVDYAHTPDALVNVLTSLRGAGFKRIIAVFGCGGDRDRSKRPLMGKAVADHADVAVLTSDNPRSEEPLAIMADVLQGLATARDIVQEPDRKTAINRALGMLKPGDALVVAGKGHEDYQIVKGVKLPFSDQETIREFLL